MNLAQHLQHFRTLYGERNDRLIPRPEQRLAFLNAGIRRLEDAYEEEQDHLYRIRLASVFARWCAIVDFLDDDGAFITRTMARKYGGPCAYCMQRPCKCPRHGRDEAKTQSVPDTYAPWSLDHWQIHLKNLYGEKNHARGVDFILRRLYSEQTEAVNHWLLHTLAPMHKEARLDPYSQDFLIELGDVLAWILAAASELEVELEAAVKLYYGRGCPSCQKAVCNCTVLAGATMNFKENRFTV